MVLRDQQAIAELKRRTEQQARYWGEIPELAEDVHDLVGLSHVADLVFAGAPDARTGAAAAEESRRVPA